MQCPACSYEPTLKEHADSPEKCVACGVYYSKHAAKIARDREQQSKPALPRPVGRIRAALQEEAQIIRATADRLKSRPSSGGRLYCPQCGTVSNGRRHVPGSILIEILLWLCFLIPGIIYSIWRLSSAKKACSSCNASGLIPVTSPRARRELDSE